MNLITTARGGKLGIQKSFEVKTEPCIYIAIRKIDIFTKKKHTGLPSKTSIFYSLKSAQKSIALHLAIS
jgi:hypothetical protein